MIFLPPPNPGSRFSLSINDTDVRLGPNSVCAFNGIESRVRVRLNVRVRVTFVGEGDRNGSEESKSRSKFGNSSLTGLAKRFPPPGKDARPVMTGGVEVSLNDFVFFIGERRLNSNEEEGVGRLL
jgi:hypothetical protein